jgi:hypothetical protein
MKTIKDRNCDLIYNSKHYWALKTQANFWKSIIWFFHLETQYVLCKSERLKVQGKNRLYITPTKTKASSLLIDCRSQWLIQITVFNHGKRSTFTLPYKNTNLFLGVCLQSNSLKLLSCTNFENSCCTKKKPNPTFD